MNRVLLVDKVAVSLEVEVNVSERVLNRLEEVEDTRLGLVRAALLGLVLSAARHVLVFDVVAVVVVVCIVGDGIVRRFGLWRRRRREFEAVVQIARRELTDNAIEHLLQTRLVCCCCLRIRRRRRRERRHHESVGGHSVGIAHYFGIGRRLGRLVGRDSCLRRWRAQRTRAERVEIDVVERAEHMCAGVVA